MITEEQRQQRMLGIGGSDAPIILGLSEYKTPYQLYLEKKGIIKDDAPMTKRQKWGHLLEPVIRDEFARVNGVTIETPDTLIHPILNFMRGNIDGYIVEWNAVLEVKNVDKYLQHKWGEEGSDIVPMEYLVQVAHYSIIKNFNCGYLAPLIGGNDDRQYKYTRDYELEKIIIEAESAFWEAVTKDLPPPPVKQIDLKLMYPQHNQAKKINLSDDIYTQFNKLTEVKAKMKELQEIEEESRFKIMEHMKDGECLVDNEGRPLVTWKTNKRGARTFLLKGEK